MRLLICGDRNWRDAELIGKVIDELKPTVVIEGEALGADWIAKQEALKRGIPVMAFPAAWKFYGKFAGPTRNRWQLHLSGAERVVGFHKNILDSKGTIDMLTYAGSQKIETVLYNASGIPIPWVRY